MDLFTYLYRIIIPEIVYTVFLTVIVYRFFYYINHRFMSADQERKGVYLGTKIKKTDQKNSTETNNCGNPCIYCNGIYPDPADF